MNSPSPPSRRGRPRRDPERLATWQPPPGWGRLVVWLSAEERRALKVVAAEADTTVADLVRALAAGLSKSVITAEELLVQYRKGSQVMEKIPTVFERDETFGVTPRVKPECQWVLDGEGEATEKVDGMNVRLTVRSGQLVRVEKRRNPTKVQKKRGIIDGWYVDANDTGPEDRWIFEAARATDVKDWPDGEHACEALGPNIQGNPLGLAQHICLPFNFKAPRYEGLTRSFDGLRDFLNSIPSRFSPGHLAEGIVFHHPDGRRAKIKRKDFREYATPADRDLSATDSGK